MKKIFSLLGLLILVSLLTGALTAAAPVPKVSFTPPADIPQAPTIIHLNVGDALPVQVVITSDQEFLFAAMLPSFFFPGRGVMATNMGGDRVGPGTSATLTVTFVAKGSTANFSGSTFCPTGADQVQVVPGARFQGGAVAHTAFVYCIAVP